MNPQTPPTMPPPEAPKKSPSLTLILGILFVLALGFSGWAFSSRQSAVKSANQKLASARQTLAQAQATQAAADAATKAPYKTYTSSTTYGNISFSYPKNWSAYVEESGGSQPINGYFYPNQVPSADSGVAFALRLELLNDDYATVLSQLQSDSGLSASAFLPAKLKGNANAQVGTRLDGAVAQDSQGNNLNGAMVVLKVRDKTLQVYTESSSFLSDFNNIVLPSLTYNP